MTTDRRSNTVAGENWPSENVLGPTVVAASDGLEPGTQVTITGTDADGNLQVDAGTNDRPTYLMVAEKRHPPSGDESRGTSLLDPTYDAGEAVEVLVFRAGDRTDNAKLATGEDSSGEIGTAFVFNTNGEVAVYDSGVHAAADIAGTLLEESNNDTASEDRVEVLFA